MIKFLCLDIRSLCEHIDGPDQSVSDCVTSYNFPLVARQIIKESQEMFF